MVFYAIWVQIKKCGKIRTALLLLVLNFCLCYAFSNYETTLRQLWEYFRTTIQSCNANAFRKTTRSSSAFHVGPLALERVIIFAQLLCWTFEILLIKFENFWMSFKQVFTYLNKFGQTKAHLNSFEHVLNKFQHGWAHLNTFEHIWTSFEKVRTHLEKFWKSSNTFEKVWTHSNQCQTSFNTFQHIWISFGQAGTHLAHLN